MKTKYVWLWLTLKHCLMLSVTGNYESPLVKFNPIKCVKSSEGKAICIVSHWDNYVTYITTLEQIIPNGTQELTIYCTTQKYSTLPMYVIDYEQLNVGLQFQRLLFWNCNFPEFSNKGLTGHAFETLRSLVFHKAFDDTKSNNPSQAKFSLICLCSLNDLTELAFTGFTIKTITLTLDCSNTTCCNKLTSLNFSMNDISNIEEGTFDNLGNLEILDLSENNINSVDKNEIAKLQSLTKIILTGNPITKLPITVFQHNAALSEITINYHSRLYYTRAPEELFALQDIIEKTVPEICTEIVNLEPNNFEFPKSLISLSICVSNSSSFDEHLLDNLMSIRTLSLVYPFSNDDQQGPVEKKIPPFVNNVLMKLTNLTELSLKYSGPLYPSMFINMNQLQILNLTLRTFANGTNATSADIFFGLHQLQVLNIDFTEMRDERTPQELVKPETLFHGLMKLKLLNVAHFQLKSFSCSTFRSLDYLKVTSMTENQVEHIESCICTHGHGTNLIQLHLSENSIQSLPKIDFKECHNLLLIDFSKNNLTSVCNDCEGECAQNKSAPTGPFSNLKKLTRLILSNNLIARFDFSMIPQSLLHLDLSYNVLTSLKDDRKICSKLNLQSLLLNQNRLIKLRSNNFPPSLRQLYLGDQLYSYESDLSVLSPLQFDADAFSNFQNVEIIRLKHIKNFKVGRKTFSNCPSTNGTYFSISWNKNCEMYAIYAALDSIAPHLDYNVFINKVIDLRIVQFYDYKMAKYLNCQYKQEFGYKCLDHQRLNNAQGDGVESWVVNVLDCSEVGFHDFPHEFPSDLPVDRLFMDGNDLNAVPFDAFASLKQSLSVLYLNNSNISEIHGDGFFGLDLQELHLENNKLTEVTRYIIELISVLKFLYLQNNHIVVVDPPMRWDHTSLIILRLDNNLITYFRKSWMTEYATQINVSDNKIAVLDTNIFQNHGNLQEFIMRNNSIKEINRLSCLIADLKKLKLIDLSHNLISAIEPKSFDRLGYLKVLDLEGNKITELNGTEFDGLIRLEKLNLIHNYISKISHNAFDNLDKLEELYLNNNLLAELYGKEFTRLLNLRILNLSYNKLKFLQNSIFSNLTLLRALDLSGNEIATLDRNLFSQLKRLTHLNVGQNYLQNVHVEFNELLNLEEIRLSNNLLSTLNVNSFANLHQLKGLYLSNNKLTRPQIWNLPDSIKTLQLTNNSLTCDCDFILDFKKWSSDVGYNKLQNIEQITCMDSRTKKAIRIQQFDTSVCHTSYELVLGVCTAVLFVLFCMLSALYYWRLEVQVWVYSRYGLRLFYKDEDNEEKAYDVFIAYSSDDEDFVCNELIPGLKDYRICVHFKDFPAGAFITEAIAEAVEQSNRTLLVFSPRFIQSPWCKFEFKSAHHKALQDRCCRLILLLLEDVDENEMEKEQKAYLRTNTYLRWDDGLFWEKLKFALSTIRPDAPANHGLLLLDYT